MADKERFNSSWYAGREYIVIEIPHPEDVDFIQELFYKKQISCDYRGLADNGNNVFVVFKDGIETVSNPQDII